MYILSVDVGTSSVKVAVLGEDLEILRSAKASYELRVLHGDWAELDAPVVYNAILRAVRELVEEGQPIGLITFDTFSPSPLLLDGDGAPLTPVVTHLDRRSKVQTQRILERVGKGRFLSVTGIQPFTGGASVTSGLWMRDERPGIFRRARWFGHLNTYLYARLTGRFATEPVNASQTGLCDTVRGIWSGELCGTLGFPERLLPDILPAGTPAPLLPNAAAELGLTPGTPVALGSNDAASALVGAGCTQVGDVLLIAGSSLMVSVLTDRPVADERYYLRASCTPGLWQLYATTAGGFAVDWVRYNCYRDLDDNAFYQGELPEAMRLAGEGCAVDYAPYIAGDRQSLTPKQASFSGVTLETTRRDLLAAVLRGMHKPMLETLRLCREFTKPGGCVRLTGGMVSGPLIELEKKLLDGFSFEVVPDAPLRGNALLGLAGTEGGCA